MENNKITFETIANITKKAQQCMSDKALESETDTMITSTDIAQVGVASLLEDLNKINSTITDVFEIVRSDIELGKHLDQIDVLMFLNYVKNYTGD